MKVNQSVWYKKYSSFAEDIFHSAPENIFYWELKVHYNVGLKCTDMLLRIYWYVVTDVLEGLNATFGVKISKRVKHCSPWIWS